MKTKTYFLTLIAFFLTCNFYSCYETDEIGAFPSENQFFVDDSFNENFSGEGYDTIVENPFVNVADQPVSTFSVDADGASYSNVRRFLNNDQLPPVNAVRIEELINYFTFDYANPQGVHPISLNGEISGCPWTSGNKLIRIGMRGKDIPRQELPAANFVFLIDVSGSMGESNKLGLLKESFKLFTDELRPQDRVAIVTYAGQAGLLLESTSGSDKNKIKNAIDKLGAGGSTAGAQGITTAYEIAQANFVTGGNNRVVLGTDGDFNVGISSQEELVKLIEEKRESGIFLTVLGVGAGNLQDGIMEQLANNGNGNYEYLDNLEQAKKVFIHEFNKFYTVAKDVKVQVHFNPDQVEAYRLIGYENRILKEEDFEDDKKDAGEVGSNQTITAIYEIVPAGSGAIGPYFTIDFRYKLPDSDDSIPLELAISDAGISFDNASENMRFAASIAGYGMLLRDSEYKGNVTYEMVKDWAEDARGFDPHDFRNGFLELVEMAEGL